MSETQDDGAGDGEAPQEYIGVARRLNVDQAGERIAFGLVLASGAEHRLEVSAPLLGVLINTLQLGARMALRRRVAKAPAVAHLDPRARRASPVRQIDMELDAAGRAALWRFTENDGTSSEAQLSLELLEGLLERLPHTISEMKKLRSGKATPS